jgi:hypothetical protein
MFVNMTLDAEFKEKVFELASCMKKEQRLPSGADCEAGKKLISVYRDVNFNFKKEPLMSLVTEACFISIADLSSDGMLLKHGFVGVHFNENKLSVFTSDFEHQPLGTTIFRVGWTERMAFQKWRKMDLLIEFDQDDVQCAVYYLTHVISEHI